MKKTQIKNLGLLLVVILMIFARSMSAQTVIYAQGNVSDLNGNPIANQLVYSSHDSTNMAMAMATTNANGDYALVVTNLSNQGILFVATEDCNLNMIIDTHIFNPNNTQVLVSNFIICDTSITTPCTFSAAYVYSSPNGLTAGTITMPPNALTYVWSNGVVGNWTTFYQNWCVQIIDSVSGCDTTICDTSFVNPSNCIETSLIDTNVICNYIFNPVCGCDSVTYSNPCIAENYFGVTSYTYGACGSTVTSCQSDFTSTQVSASDSTFFTNLSSGTNASTSYFWDFGDNSLSTDENPVHLYAQSGTYYVCLTIMDSTTNCYDTYCDYLTVVVAGGNGCQAYFYSMPALIQVVNSFNFYDISSGNSSNWLWDFGDGNTSNQQNPAHSYNPIATGFFLVCLTIEEYDPITQALICTDTYCDSIYLTNQPFSCQAGFYGQDLGNNEGMFTNTSYPQSVFVSNVDIDYGDGNIDYNILSSVNHTYASSGTYYVCVTVTEYDAQQAVICTDTYCDSVSVTSGSMPCQANFCSTIDSSVIITQNSNGTTTTTIGDIFFFCDLSNPVGMIQSWQWDMGDNGAGQYLQNTSSTSQAPVYEFDTNGVYYVCLSINTIGGQCNSTSCDSVDFSMLQSQTAIEEINAFQELKLYPNPASDRVTVNLVSNTIGDLSIRLVNMMGQTLSYSTIIIFNGAINHSLDVSKIANGVYSVEVVLNGEKQHQRVVISR